MIANMNSKVRDTALLFIQLEIRLIELMATEKVYLRKDLSLSELANLLDTNMNYLSQIINHRLRTSFNDYINSYRIKEACIILQSDFSEKHSVHHVGDLVGFSSRSTFYSTFKKFTGTSPALYQLEMTQEKNSAASTTK